MKEDKEKEKGEVSRRDFLVGAGAVVVGGAIGAGITYPLVAGKEAEVTTTTKTVETTKTVSVPTTVTKTVGDGATATVTDTVTTTVSDGDGAVQPYLEPETTTVKVYCQITAVDSKNGRIVRVRPLHYDSKYPNLQPWSITARGKTLTFPMKSPACSYTLGYRKRTTSRNRPLYPLQRVDWEPGGDPAKINPQNRGISKYKRISWDEAATIIASELTRVADTYGPEAITDLYYSGHSEWHSVPGSNNCFSTFLQYWAHSKYGAPVTERHRPVRSQAGGVLGSRFAWGSSGSGHEGTGGLLKDVSDNTEMLLCWGSNMEANSRYRTSGQMQTMIFHWWGELGIKRVFINPDMNVSAGLNADKWVPVLPNTDCAFMLAVAHTWISEGTYDQDYLDTHGVGFDKWRAYVMGDEDGIPKTPEWASPLCGVPEWTIKAVAREWASHITSIHVGAYGGGLGGRSVYVHEATRMRVYLLAMQGWGAPGKHLVRGISIPGAATSLSIGGVSANSQIRSALSADFGVSLSSSDRDRPFIERGNLYDCLNNPPVSWWFDGDPFYKRTYPMEGKSEVHLSWGTNIPFTASVGYGFRKNKALRSPNLECFINQGMYFEDSAFFSDIFLPITNMHEIDDLNSRGDTFTIINVQRKATEPIGEAKTDKVAIGEVAKKLGIYEESTLGSDDWDMIRQGYENSGWQDLVSWEELYENGYFPQPIDPDWEEQTPSSLAFYNDPVANPLRIPTGLIEFESAELLEHFPDDKERPPVAHYVRGGPKAEGWTHDEDRLLSAKANDYPLLMQSAIREWGHHSSHTDISWTREIRYIVGWDGYAYSPCWINPVDAAARGIEDGDIVRVYNDRGSVLAGAVVAEKMIPGAVHMDKAGGSDMIDPVSINRGGNINAIAPDETASYHAYGLVPTGYLVEVEKVTGNQMDEWRKNYPEAFARDYDPAYGPFFESWVEGGM